MTADESQVEASSRRRLAPAEAEAIVSIRGLLDEALSRAADSTVVGRRVAAVLMDGAAEAAMTAGLARYNAGPTERAAFDELHRRLTEHLRNAGRLEAAEGLDGWPDVRRLRLVRNNAQHHQIPPDHQTLVAWSGGIRRFVAHIVAAAYDVELTTVSIASAIEHDDLRAQFVKAEEARAEGDTRSAVGRLSRVFNDAQRLWDTQRQAAIGVSWKSPRDEFGINEAIAKATRHLDETLTIAPFALDLGEFFWWQKLLRDCADDTVVVTESDVARAEAFVFTWVVRWESFSARYLGRDRVPTEPPADAPPSHRPDGATELDAEREPTVEMRLTSQYSFGPQVERWLFRVPYRHGRPDDPYRRHAHYLEQELNSQDPPQPWKGYAWRHAGDILVPIDPTDFDADAVLDALEQAFQRARRREEEAVTQAVAMRAERQRREELVQAVTDDILAFRHRDEQPFIRVALESRDAEHLVFIGFEPTFESRLRTEIFDVRPVAEPLPKVPPPARLRYDGVEVPLGHIGELLQLAANSLAVLDEERRRLQDDRTARLALVETLDAAAKEVMRRRAVPPPLDA